MSPKTQNPIENQNRQQAADQQTIDLATTDWGLLEKQFYYAIKLETCAADLYRQLAMLFEEDSQFSTLLMGLAEEEDQHARRIRALKRDCIADPSLCASLELNIGEVELLIREAKMLQAMFADDGHLLTMNQLRRLLQNIEHRFSIVHADIISGTLSPHISDFFRKLKEEDKKHEECLKNFGF